MLLIFLILAAIVLAQPPAQGIQLGSIPDGRDLRFPLTATQCEPVFIFYNNTRSSGPGVIGVELITAELGDTGSAYNLLTIGPIPVGAGFFEWICNIPAGYGFWAAFGPGSYLYYTIVQPGPLSSCLHNVTTTYQYASYATAIFESYTASIRTATSPPSAYLAT
jgi:hypothetical protein